MNLIASLNLPSYYDLTKLYLWFEISAGLRPGSLIGTVRANDIDTFPPISYKISNSDDVTEVAVDTFTGQIYLLQKPSNWRTNPFMVTISASDQVDLKSL
jgi:hypothetical protein